MGTVVSVRIRGNSYSVDVGDISKSPVVVVVDGEKFEVELDAQPKKTIQAVTKVQPRPTPAQNTEAPGRTTPSSSSPVAAPAPVATKPDGNTVVAPMPGKILSLNVKSGDSVSSSDVVCVLEAMKMEQFVKAGRDGIVDAVMVGPGQMVSPGAALLTFKG